jgi:hypothetical protein
LKNDEMVACAKWLKMPRNFARRSTMCTFLRYGLAVSATFFFFTIAIDISEADKVKDCV